MAIVYKDGPNGRRYYARILTGRGPKDKIQRGGYRTKAAAERMERKLIDLRDSGRLHLLGAGRREAGECTLVELADAYMAWSRRQHRTWKDVRTHLRHLLAFFGPDREVVSIGLREAQDYAQHRRGQGRSISTVNRELTTLKAMVRRGVEWGTLKEHHLSQMRKLAGEKVRTRVLSRAECDRLLEAASRDPVAHWRPLIEMALETGMRLGELQDLTWDRVLLDERIAIVEGGKTESSNREVPLSARAVEILEATEHRAGCVIRGGEGGRFWFRTRTWQSICKRGKVRDCRFHDLRRTFATRMLNAGMPERHLQLILGHSSQRMLATYTHPSTQDLLGSLARTTDTITDTAAVRRAVDGGGSDEESEA